MSEVQILVVTLLAGIGGAAVLFAYWHAIIENRTSLRLIRWLRAHHPDAWNAQTSLARILNRPGALAAIANAGTVDDPHFQELYVKVTFHRRRKLVGLTVGVPLLALFAAGVKFWGW